MADDIIATILETYRGGRPTYTLRVLVPGRPVISTRNYRDRASAEARARADWPGARIVDVDEFERVRQGGASLAHD